MRMYTFLPQRLPYLIWKVLVPGLPGLGCHLIPSIHTEFLDIRTWHCEPERLQLSRDVLQSTILDSLSDVLVKHQTSPFSAPYASLNVGFIILMEVMLALASAQKGMQHRH
jgi:hypothetical protein